MNCLAWWLITTKTAQQVAEFLDKRQDLTALPLAIVRCRAWVWLHQHTAADIRHALEKMPEQMASDLRRELNTIRFMIKSHTEGDTYE